MSSEVLALCIHGIAGRALGCFVSFRFVSLFCLLVLLVAICFWLVFCFLALARSRLVAWLRLSLTTFKSSTDEVELGKRMDACMTFSFAFPVSLSHSCFNSFTAIPLRLLSFISFAVVISPLINTKKSWKERPLSVEEQAGFITLSYILHCMHNVFKPSSHPATTHQTANPHFWLTGLP